MWVGMQQEGGRVGYTGAFYGGGWGCCVAVMGAGLCGIPCDGLGGTAVGDRWRGAENVLEVRLEISPSVFLKGVKLPFERCIPWRVDLARNENTLFRPPPAAATGMNSMSESTHPRSQQAVPTKDRRCLRTDGAVGSTRRMRPNWVFLQDAACPRRPSFRGVPIDSVYYAGHDWHGVGY